MMQAVIIMKIKALVEKNMAIIRCA